MAGYSGQYFLNFLNKNYMKKNYFVMVKNREFIEVSKFWFYSYVFGVFEQVLIFGLLFIIYITNLHKILLYFNS